MVPPTPKRMMWRVTEAPRRMLRRSLCWSFASSSWFWCPHSTDLDEVDVTPRFAEVFGSMLSGVGGSAGGWQCCWDAPSLPQLPSATPKNPPLCRSLLFLRFCRGGVTNTISGRLEVNLSLSETFLCLTCSNVAWLNPLAFSCNLYRK